QSDDASHARVAGGVLERGGGTHGKAVGDDPARVAEQAQTLGLIDDGGKVVAFADAEGGSLAGGSAVGAVVEEHDIMAEAVERPRPVEMALLDLQPAVQHDHGQTVCGTGGAFGGGAVPGVEFEAVGGDDAEAVSAASPTGL